MISNNLKYDSIVVHFLNHLSHAYLDVIDIFLPFGIQRFFVYIKTTKLQHKHKTL